MSNAVFRVLVNQVEVGAIPEQDYRAIVATVTEQVKADRFLYLQQAGNLMYGTFVVVSTALKFVPVMLFLLFVGGVLGAPGMVTELIDQVRASTSAQVTQGLRQLVVWTGMLSVFSFPVAVLLTGYEFGFVNKFKSAKSERISFHIRALLEVPAEGEVAVLVDKDFRL